ncbi:tetratricopeptide repeat protein [Rhodopila globiformis]|uniref:Uncharacterized protein n=1 Tax=Rhodopila globiformis TaxID=1071 RepID=A0A2S6MZI6_RHOGL|nr:tetratricopeptide repeat protein [Rhodopila globiformis]PPQ27769.1 hypothetical protein CCS01_26645 [Rhodopila globiformis]
MSPTLRRTATGRSEAERLAAFRKVFADALHQQQAGAIDEAIANWRRALKLNPGSAEAYCNLGAAWRQKRRPKEAVTCLRKAIELNPDHVEAHNNLGNALKDLGRIEEAVACHRRAVALRPDCLEAHAGLADTLEAQGSWEAAVAAYQDLLRLRPGHVEACIRLGICLQTLGRSDEAIDCLCAAIEQRPESPEALFFLGCALQARDRLAEAVACYRAAAGLQPDLAEAYGNQAEALRLQGLVDEALACAHKAVALRPGHAGFLNGRGIALQAVGRWQDAAASYREAIRADARFYQAHVNLGLVLHQMQRLDDAVAAYDIALGLAPDDPDLRWNRSTALLARGDFAEGWAEFEWRWRTPQLRRGHRRFAQPQWRGEAAPGRTLLIHAEQGFGDTLQFCRYATLAAARGLRVVMQVPRPLVRLLGTLAGPAAVVPEEDELPDFDLHCPMMSLPLAMKTTLETIPAPTAYLHADPEQAALWRSRIRTLCGDGPRVGLVWAGNPRANRPVAAAADRRRSMPAGCVAPLLDVPAVRFFSLQKDGPGMPPGSPLIDLMHDVQDFADTAALVANLDLVVSVDTAVAHLAAAMGKPVWLADRFDSCWRWLANRRDSPWYPALRIYRQPHPGDWDDVIATIRRDLLAWSNKS